MMSSAAALQAPLAPEPVLEALRSFGRSDPECKTASPRGAAAVASAQPTSAVEQPARDDSVTWVDPPESLWLLSLKNYGLTLATFGVYHFWGRAELNRQMINAVHVKGKPLDYSGTGRESFISFVLGALIAVSIVGAFFALILMNRTAGGTGGIEGIREIRWHRLFISLPLLFLLGSIAYRRRQHILRRTWISGSRFDLSGHPWAYAWRHFWSAFTVPLTLGWAAPWRMSTLEARKIDEMHYGQFRFRAAPDLKPLYKAFAALWFGGGLLYVATLVVLAMFIGNEIMSAVNGLTLAPLLHAHVAAAAVKVLGVALLPLATMLLIYRKAWIEHQISAIAFDGGRLHLRLPLGRYLAMAYRGAALSIISLGCFKPVAKAQMLRFIVDHVQVHGDLNLDPAKVAT